MNTHVGSMCHPYTLLLTFANVIVRSTSDYIMNYSNYINCVYKYE